MWREHQLPTETPHQGAWMAIVDKMMAAAWLMQAAVEMLNRNDDVLSGACHGFIGAGPPPGVGGMAGRRLCPPRAQDSPQAERQELATGDQSAPRERRASHRVVRELRAVGGR